jgi:hypothetical protein
MIYRFYNFIDGNDKEFSATLEIDEEGAAFKRLITLLANRARDSSRKVATIWLGSHQGARQGAALILG